MFVPSLGTSDMGIFEEIWKENRERFKLIVGELFDFLLVILFLTICRFCFEFFPVLSEEMKELYNDAYEFIVVGWLF